MGALKPWHIIVLVVVLILLFGAKKLPDAARGLGRSLRILKAETKNLRDEAKADDEMDSKADAQHARKPAATIEGEAVSQPARDKTHEDGR
ncbi:Sec-independent protein translocase subunit TatA [Phytomonospora endophytica]|uniref:Sec-independent protein translocase protein TatA n=1 Tax=Phytomonospora endophytica TaxID=714109 RepID=A0A841FUP6_9ACTN|nr:Sec-independent protein translocase subunit TatA [Phytomonospora endophytica]MBB6035700.1 sec-independent protein translocase protein TatA [Phytomonospora endophytica]GIG69623.1 Sec-independent protein translocase protein TatA [Phytomonospora endophytica]